MIGLFGKKVGMSQIFDENGDVITVTVIKAGPCPVVQIKEEEKEGYNSVQIAYELKKSTRATLPEIGHFKKSDLPPYRHLREIRTDDIDKYQPGQLLGVDMFKESDTVDISGKSKGKGFQGVVKRYGFGGGRKTHGGRGLRKTGSIGMSADPSRVIKGKKMPGRMGGENIHIKNLKVVEVDPDNDLLLVKGSVPGPRNNILWITRR
ncbi:MAG: 50S ribosomal protein L3 [Candidatus Latescibacteria bacterium]|nr:50S ribosomal protein L3 [Candidatus Latescibacterota bacterium]